MNWKEKIEALASLESDIAIRYRPEGTVCAGNQDHIWYITQSVDVKKGSILHGRYGNGETPEEAIEDHWNRLTELEEDEYLVIHAGAMNRKAVKWNGFMWKEVKE
jgi:hypothetical protein